MAGSTTERVYSGRRKVVLPEEDSSQSLGRFFKSVKDTITGSSKDIPDDEYEYEENPGIENIPIESSDEEYRDIMDVISRRKPREMVEDVVTNSIPLSRVKIISGATPAQLEDNVNKYLNAIESDAKLVNVSINDIKFSATQNGYSVLIWMSKIE